MALIIVPRVGDVLAPEGPSLAQSAPASNSAFVGPTSVGVSRSPSATVP